MFAAEEPLFTGDGDFEGDGDCIDECLELLADSSEDSDELSLDLLEAKNFSNLDWCPWFCFCSTSNFNEMSFENEPIVSLNDAMISPIACIRFVGC